MNGVRSTYGKVEDDEVGRGNGSKMLVCTRGLDDRLGGERDHTNPETLEDLNDNDLRLGVGALSESDHESISECLDGEPDDDDGFQSSNVPGDNGCDDGDDGGCETRDRCESTRR